MRTHKRHRMMFIVILLSFCSVSLVFSQESQSDENQSQKDVHEQLETLKQTIREQREKLVEQEARNKKLMKRLEKLEQSVSASSGSSGEAEDEEREKKLEKRVDELQQELTRLKFQMPDNPEPVLPEGLQSQEEPNALNPMITIFSNHLFRADNRDVRKGGSRVDETYRLRANEIDFRSPIGPYADGVAILAVPQRPDGSFDAKFEEIYAQFKDYPFFSEPPLDMRVKLGRFRTEAGRMNRLHFHDLPQPDRPYAFREFIGGGGWQGEGISTRFRLPTDFVDTESDLSLTLQAFENSDGLRFAEAGDSGSAIEEPGFLANLRWTRTFADQHFLDVSLIGYEGYHDSNVAGEQPVSMQSVDALYKWKPARQGEWTSFILGGQVYRGDREFVSGGVEQEEQPIGGYLWSQYQFDRRWFSGARYDYSEDLFNDNLVTEAIEPYVTYKWNEALQTRIGFRHQWSDLQREDGLNTVFLELTFWFGSHPPHPFWVEK